MKKTKALQVRSDKMSDQVFVDFTKKTDAELLNYYQESLPGFKGYHAIMRACLSEIHTRFKAARRKKQSFLDFPPSAGDFNDFCAARLDITGRQVRRITAKLDAASAASNTPEWWIVEFGNDCEKRHAEILEACLQNHIYQTFRDVGNSEWAPWRPYSDSDKKKWTPIKDRYKLTLFLSQKQLETLTWQD